MTFSQQALIGLCDEVLRASRLLVKNDLTGAWVVHPKTANFHWSPFKSCTNSASEFLAPEVELTHSANFVAQNPEGGEHEHVAQVAIRKSDEEKTNSDG